MYVNIDGSPDFALASYIAAQITGCKAYTMSDNNKVTELSMPPLKEIGEDKIWIIKKLEEKDGEIMSVQKLIDEIEGLADDQKEYMSQRAKTEYHLNALETDGVVRVSKVGKQAKIKLTGLGWAYSQNKS